MPGVAARGWLSLATRSGLGGTMGRAAGWPASGLAVGRIALGAAPPLDMGAASEGAAGARGEAGARPMIPGLATGAAGRRASPDPAGKGWRGPERI